MGLIQDGLEFIGLRIAGLGLNGSRGAEELALNPLKLVDLLEGLRVEPLDEGRLVVAVVRPQVVGGVGGADETGPEAVIDRGSGSPLLGGLPDHNIVGLGQEGLGEGGGVRRQVIWSFCRPSNCKISEDEELPNSTTGEV